MVRVWRSWGRISLVAASVLVLVLGCGGSGGNGSSQDEGGGDPAGTSSPNGGPNTPGGEDSGDGDGGNGDGDGSTEGIAWVPFGPNDPTFPTPSWPAYNAFAAGECGALRNYFEGDGSQLGGSDFGKAMLAVCRAAFDGSEDQWAVAEEFAGADPSPLAHECLASLVTGGMSRAIAWHKANPGKKPAVQIQREGDGVTDCGQKDHEAQNPPTEEPTTDESGDSSPTPDEAPQTDEPTESTG